MPLQSRTFKTLLLSLLVMFTCQQAITAIMRYSSQPTPSFFAALSALNIASAQSNVASNNGTCTGNQTVDLDWHAPARSSINSLSSAINGTGIYGFIFNSSQGPLDTYNWCNMPHVNPKTYPRVKDSSYKLEYVEIIQRHHKRTPYAANTFPVENYSWYCDDEGLFYGGQPINPPGNLSSDTYWSVYTSPSNPLAPQGFNGTCQFPQITRGGLDDSHQHGADLKSVYHGLLDFIPADYDSRAVSYRVTSNVITSQVASMLIAGMYPSRANKDTPLLIQPNTIDSLQPSYSCPASTSLFSSYGSGSSSPAWLEHINAASSLFSRLDALSGIAPSNAEWHASFDHYFDNLSARLCHAKPLPCKTNATSDCVSLAEAEKVFRLGQYEYSFIYRDSPESLRASTSGYGIWVAELAQNLRSAMSQGASSAGSAESPGARYRHNVAHDGSVSRLLSILQLEKMVWPGMGAEVVFELYNKAGCYFLRVLWGGQVMRSSHPALGSLDLLPVETVLAYFDGLVGVGAEKVPGLCRR
ncbi:hypothetical protein Q7P37_009003 [Cladosporium fusiforme]